MATPSTAAVKSAISSLEQTYVTGLAARNQLYSHYQQLPDDAMNGARRTVAFADLRQRVTTTAREEAATVDRLFRELVAAAQAHVADTAVAATETPLYRAYQQEL